jgi:hypothetical protein
VPISTLRAGALARTRKEADIRCREGFRKLLENCGFAAQKRMPRLVACGGRDAAYDAFKIAQKTNVAGNFVALWVDSEEPLADLEAA